MNSPQRTLARLSALLLFALGACAPSAAGAQSYLKSQPIGGNPGPANNYVCPNADGKPALDCFYDAVRHLYTMCRQVKSIEIIEYGYEKSQEGVNGAKSEYCVDKQKQNMWRLYQAALKDASHLSKQAADGVRVLHEYWLGSLEKLRWMPGESDGDYQARTTKVYEVLDMRVEGIKTAVAAVPDRSAKTAPASGAHAKASK